MNLATRLSTTDAADLPSVLASWYAEQSSVRRLRATEESSSIVVHISLEPTSDGDDALPVWFANNGRWASDLTALTRRNVQLKLVVADPFDELDADSSGDVIAELSWREPWAFT
ncbi:hypothetical protein HNQ60_002867 [Povalibacter uvarum]|uniref:Uncharacterized protein n=1 Tax=Povalibacter uvarum TaxID=732238 RepID=A0A841HM89_9GAMM|nr:hypothetical protein [Povalibacter uvarum]MBB6093986.1 hypothetical protein [Povalibacter uvarum]